MCLFYSLSDYKYPVPGWTHTILTSCWTPCALQQSLPCQLSNPSGQHIPVTALLQ